MMMTLLRQVLPVISDLVLIAAVFLGTVFYLHMLQLSSYQFRGFLRFLTTHRQYVAVHLLLLIIPIITLLLTGEALVYSLVMLVVGVLLVGVFWPRAQKKKFVVTLRVGRLITILCFLYLAWFAVCLAFRGFRLSDGVRTWAVQLPFAAALLPLTVALAELLALPGERAVHNWYINDAKRMLAEHPGLRIIGVTGSFGKTSVKHYLTEMLSEKYAVLMTPGSFNTPMGVVRTIREQLKPTHEIFICEMGARHVGDIREICDIVHPHDGVLTAIGDQHLETFHTRDNIIATKYELLDAVEAAAKSSDASQPRGAAFAADQACLKFINGDDEILREHRKYPDAITYGLEEGNAYRGEILSVTAQGTRFRVTAPAGEDGAVCSEEITMPLVGRHNVVNVLGAISVAHRLGVPLAKCRTAARRLKVAEHRLEIKKAPYGVILDDAYNANPMGAQAALETMEAVAASGADASGRPMLKILVTPGMVELGEKQAQYNEAFGAQAAAVCDLIYVVGRTNREAIIRGAVQAGMDPERVIACQTLLEATTKMVSPEAGRPRVVLLENDLPDDY